MAYLIHYWPPIRFYTIDHYPLDPPTESVFGSFFCLFIYPSTVSLWEKVWKALWNSKKTIFTVPHSSYGRVISLQRFIWLVFILCLPLSEPTWTTPDDFFSFMYLEMNCRISCSVLFPEIDWPVVPWVFLLPLLQDATDIYFLSGFGHFSLLPQ